MKTPARAALLALLALLTTAWTPAPAHADWETTKWDRFAEVRDGGWTVAFGNDIGAVEYAKGAMALWGGPGPFAAYVEDLLNESAAALRDSIRRNIGPEVRDRLLAWAKERLTVLFGGDGSNEAQIDGIDVKAGIVSHSGREVFWKIEGPLVTAYTPYVAIRIRGATAIDARTPGFAAPDLICGVKHFTTQSGFVEIHEARLHAPTVPVAQKVTRIPQPDPTDPNGVRFGFDFADWNSDGVLDLFAVKLSHTDSGKIEVHVVNGRNGRDFLLQVPTKVAASQAGAPSPYRVVVHDVDRDGRPDVALVKCRETDHAKTEVHVLSGAANFQSFVAQKETSLGVESGGRRFDFCDWNGDGRADLAMAETTQSRPLTITILAGPEFRTELATLRTSAEPGAFEEFWSFSMGHYRTAPAPQDTTPDIALFKNPGTAHLEVHVANGANPGQWLLQQSTFLDRNNGTFWTFLR